MRKLINSVKKLKQSEIKHLVNKKTKEFNKKRSDDELFNELCFCLLTANFNAKGALKIEKEIGNKFNFLTEKQLAKKLKELGHRFPNARANYIYEARKNKNKLIEKINSLNDFELRDWIIKNMRGLGYKESSHFLRNIGYTDFAIIDFHIIDILTDHEIIEMPKTLTKNKYLEIEKTMKKLADKLEINMSELDMYLWYLETGKILK